MIEEHRPRPGLAPVFALNALDPQQKAVVRAVEGILNDRGGDVEFLPFGVVYTYPHVCDFLLTTPHLAAVHFVDLQRNPTLLFLVLLVLFIPGSSLGGLFPADEDIQLGLGHLGTGGSHGCRL